MLQAINISALAQADPPSDTQGGGVGDHAFHLVQALPVEAHISMGLILLVGLVLWLFGGRLIRPLFAIVGIALGGLVGLVVLPAIGLEEVGGAPGSLVGMGIGAVVGLILALVMLKVAIVFAAGLGFAAAGLLGGTVYLQYNPLPDDEPPAFVIDDGAERDPSGRRLFTNPYTGEQMTIEELTRTLREADRILRGPDGADGSAGADDESASKRFEAICVRCRAVLLEAYDTAKSHVNALSTRERLVVLGSTLGSMALGLVVGFLMPKKSTAAITSLAGSAIWLTAAVWLADAFVPQLSSITSQPPEAWAIVWGLLFLIGMVVQLAGIGREDEKKTKDGSKNKDDKEKEDDRKDKE